MCHDHKRLSRGNAPEAEYFTLEIFEAARFNRGVLVVKMPLVSGTKPEGSGPHNID